MLHDIGMFEPGNTGTTTRNVKLWIKEGNVEQYNMLYYNESSDVV